MSLYTNEPEASTAVRYIIITLENVLNFDNIKQQALS